VSRILLLSFTDISRDPRVRRHIDALRTEHDVVTCGRGPAADGVVEHLQINDAAWHLPLSPLGIAALLARRHDAAYGRIPAVQEARAALGDQRFDLVIANDAVTLPVALGIARSRPVLADLHEFAPLEMEEDWRWRLLLQRFATWLCATYLPQVAAVTTVSPGLAERYHRDYGVTPTVVTNAGPTRTSVPDRPTRMPVRVVHAGNANPNRGIDVMIEAAAGLENICLDLYLVEVPRAGRYLDRLREMASSSPNVRVLDPVLMAEVVPTLESYDVGLYALQPTSFNNLHALPNKLFDFVQAGLAIVIGPSPDMASLVHAHGLGLVADSFRMEDVRRVLASLSADGVDACRANARSARHALSSSVQAEILRRVVRGLL